MNKAIIIGNLTKDVESGTSNAGTVWANFTVAVTRRYSNQQGTKETDFIPVRVYGKVAENCAKYLSKGKKAAVVGAVQTRSYDAQDGSKRYVTEILAEEVEFLSPKDQSAAVAADADGLIESDQGLPY